MKPGAKIGLGIFTSLATIGFIFTYDFYIKERIDSTEVVVVKAGESIVKSEPITEEKLIIERRPKENLIDGVITSKDMDKIIGFDSKQTIVGNSMVSKEMVDFDELIPDASKGEAIRPIKEEWINASPGSLRRKDTIDIYLVYRDGTTSLTQDGPRKVSSTETESATTESTSPETTAPTEDKEKIKMDTNPFLKGVKVVYVKDTGNKEVVSAQQNAEDKRLDATSSISQLEIILNEKDFSSLMDEVLGKGARLYITYQ